MSLKIHAHVLSFLFLGGLDNALTTPSPTWFHNSSLLILICFHYQVVEAAKQLHLKEYVVLDGSEFMFKLAAMVECKGIIGSDDRWICNHLKNLFVYSIQLKWTGVFFFLWQVNISKWWPFLVDDISIWFLILFLLLVCFYLSTKIIWKMCYNIYYNNTNIM